MKCQGFKTAGIASGLKKSGEKDLGLLYSEVPAKVAGVFTRNRVQAAPVILDRERIKSGVSQAIIVNSGNANCCTGDQGMRNAEAMATFAASTLGISEDMVLVASTWVIGQQLDTDKIETAVPDLVKALSFGGITDLAESIMTTDTFPKTASRHGEMGGKTITISGVAKGSGMICPDMATMLCFVCTDVDIAPDLLHKTLSDANDKSFNRITVDGDASTNDTVIVMANGLSGAVVRSPAEKAFFQGLLDDVLIDLAKQIVKDGEGATKIVEIAVKGAQTDEDARKIAKTVANSNLVKTAFFGEDANWGRILAAAGRAGATLAPDTIDIYFDDVQMVKNTSGCGDDVEAEATAVLKKSEFTVTIDLNMGDGCASMFTCDFSVDYVRINADYRS
ncbi:MAG: bifunctional glutamate N-acetyltransferase/amino-acid acetyltransferase ArgJ [Deltaproteobacteria bacterium]|nr:bifunctional glutamate N-acetyltransferase/amino-acid acetyltransferase ArgJ [Deltaproteobacteria bacterium]